MERQYGYASIYTHSKKSKSKISGKVVCIKESPHCSTDNATITPTSLEKATTTHSGGHARCYYEGKLEED